MRQSDKWVKCQAQRLAISGLQPRRRPVGSGTCHRCILEPVLLNNFTNDLDDKTGCASNKLADDIWLGGVLDTPDGCAAAAIQRDLNTWEKQANSNLTMFNKAKCHMWLSGKKTPMDHPASNFVEKDVGVLLDTMNFAAMHLCSKGHQHLGLH